MNTKRRLLVPWLLSALVMYGLSYVWHGLVLTDLQELRIPLTLYLILAALVYVIIGLGLTVITQVAIGHEWISLKRGFPFMATLLGAAFGFIVYMIVFILGMSFAKHSVEHVVVDVLWQMAEQGIGGLMVSLGIIHDMHRTFLESER